MSEVHKAALVGFAFLICVALVFGSYLAIAVKPETSTISQSSSCSTPYEYGSVNPISVLVLSSGQTGTICVRYTNSFNVSYSSPAYITVYNLTGHGACFTCSSVNVLSSFLVSASPDNVSFSSGKPNSSQIVTYTLTVPSNVTSGTFGIALLQFCSLFPLVVVPNANSLSALSSSQFSSWYPHSGTCPAQFLSAEVLGVSGFKVVPAN